MISEQSHTGCVVRGDGERKIMQAKNVILLIVLFGFLIIFSDPVHRVSASGTTQ